MAASIAVTESLGVIGASCPPMSVLTHLVQRGCDDLIDDGFEVQERAIVQLNLSPWMEGGDQNTIMAKFNCQVGRNHVQGRFGAAICIHA